MHQTNQGRRFERDWRFINANIRPIVRDAKHLGRIAACIRGRPQQAARDQTNDGMADDVALELGHRPCRPDTIACSSRAARALRISRNCLASSFHCSLAFSTRAGSSARLAVGSEARATPSRRAKAV